jgi:hypothetical protein
VSRVLVVASRRAQEEAERLGIPGVVENRIEAAILCGRKKNHAPGLTLGGDQRAVWLGPRLLAVLERDGRTASGTRRWRALRVVQAAGRGPAGETF